MTDRAFSSEEQQFMDEVGIRPDQLEWLVADAPPPSAAVQQRLQALTRERLGLPEGRRAPGHLAGKRAWMAAAAIFLTLGGLALVRMPAVQGALQQMFRLVPGIGIVATTEQTLVLAEPVTVAGERGTLTVTAFLATPTGTELRFRLDDLQGSPGPARGRFREEPPMRAVLVVPGGSLEATSVIAGVGEGHGVGVITFPPLPGSPTTVEFRLEHFHGLTDPFHADLPLVDIAAADLPGAVAGGWSELKNSVTVGVPHAAYTGDQIVLTLTALTDAEGARIEAIGGLAAAGDLAEALVVTDDLGNQYPLLEEENSLDGGMGQTRAVFLRGPVQPGASSLTVTLAGVQVREAGEARLRVPYDQLPLGERVALDRELLVGRWPVKVRAVTRAAVDRFLLDLDLGAPQDGALLQTVRIEPNGFAGSASSSGYSLEGDGQAREYQLEFMPAGRYLDLTFSEPSVYVTGPWQVEVAVAVPLPPEPPSEAGEAPGN